MTREEEIYEAACKAAVKAIHGTHSHVSLNTFTAGAMWADKNPTEEYKKAIEALNKIGILCKSGEAFTIGFVGEIEQMVREALGIEDKFPY